MAFQINSLTITKIMLLAPFFLGISSVGAAPLNDIDDAIADAIADGQISEVAQAIAKGIEEGIEEGLAKADNNNGTTTSEEFLKEGESCYPPGSTLWVKYKRKVCAEGLRCYTYDGCNPAGMCDKMARAGKCVPKEIRQLGETCSNDAGSEKCAGSLICASPNAEPSKCWPSGWI